MLVQLIVALGTESIRNVKGDSCDLDTATMRFPGHSNSHLHINIWISSIDAMFFVDIKHDKQSRDIALLCCS